MIERFGCFKESLIRTYLKQILLGLSYLHAQNVIHRDIKGGNILIDNFGKCKLADFGSSKQLSDFAHDTLGSICGTPNYMAPEVINQEQYGKKADIWSLGCTIQLNQIFYTIIEMATGYPPFSEFKDAITIMVKIGKSTQPPPIPPQLTSAESKQFLQLCLQIDPKKRATVDELLEHSFLKKQKIIPNTQKPFLTKQQFDKNDSKHSLLLENDVEVDLIESNSPKLQGKQGESVSKTNQINVKKKMEYQNYNLIVESDQNDSIQGLKQQQQKDLKNLEINTKNLISKIDDTKFIEKQQQNLQNDLDAVLNQYR